MLRRHFRLDENAPCTEQGGDAAAGQEQRAGEGEGESEEWWRAPAGWRADAGPCYVLQEGAPPPSPRTNWTRLVLDPVLSGHVSLQEGARARDAGWWEEYERMQQALRKAAGVVWQGEIARGKEGERGHMAPRLFISAAEEELRRGIIFVPARQQAERTLVLRRHFTALEPESECAADFLDIKRSGGVDQDLQHLLWEQVTTNFAPRFQEHAQNIHS